MDSFTLPLKLTCSVTGKVVTYTSREYVEKKLEKFGGSMERLMKEFVCRDAKSATSTKQPKAIKTDTTEITIGASVEEPPSAPIIKHDFKVGKPTPMTKADAPVDTCFSPGWYLSHASCNGCAVIGICNFNRKKITT